MNLVSLLFGFSGRINRAQYWLGCLIAGAGGAVLFFMLAVLTMPEGGVPKDGLGALQAISSMGFAIGVPLMLMSWCGSALQTKRLHDRGRSGLWALAPLVPVLMIVVSIVSGLATDMHPEQVASSLMVWLVILQAVNIVMFVDVGCMPSKREQNKFGPPMGGGSTGGAPAKGEPNIGKTKPAAPPIPGMGSTLTGAENAIERAIAAQGKASTLKPATAARTVTSSPLAGGLKPAAAGGSFGRKAPR